MSDEKYCLERAVELPRDTVTQTLYLVTSFLFLTTIAVSVTVSPIFAYLALPDVFFMVLFFNSRLNRRAGWAPKRQLSK